MIDRPDTETWTGRLNRSIEAHVVRKTLRDFSNRIRFSSRTCPLSDMAIFPVPREIAFSHIRQGKDPVLRRQQSGLVIGGDWDLHRKDIEQNSKLASCRMRWEQGADWEETPVFRRLLDEIARGLAPDGCRSREELEERYRKLDRIFEETRARGRLLLMRELPDFYRREHGATLVHVGRDGTLLRSGGGAHRFAIARILDLPEMPAQLGAVHVEAMRGDPLRDLVRSRFAAD